MKRTIIFTALILILVSGISISYAGWLIYHKPEFRGKVIDAETKAPIEGAVVVAIYKKHTLISGPGGGYSSIINIKELLTDKKGEVKFPPYTTIIQPLSIEYYVEFIIYKPGYGTYPGLQVSPPGIVHPEFFFSREYGASDTVQIDYKTIKFTTGLVELPKLKTRKERLRAMPSPVEDSGHKSDWYWKKQKQFIRILNEENKNLGLTGEYIIEE